MVTGLRPSINNGKRKTQVKTSAARWGFGVISKHNRGTKRLCMARQASRANTSELHRPLPEWSAREINDHAQRWPERRPFAANTRRNAAVAP